MRGNHTWIEVWDGGWRFAGAAEPDGNGLDRGWFAGDAAKADDAKPEHRIYASSFKKTGVSFPLVWNRRLDWVPAVNVTDRYTGKDQVKDGRVLALIRVLDRVGGRRVATLVVVEDVADTAQTWSGTSSDESADLNNILPFKVVPGRRYKVTVGEVGSASTKTHEITANSEAEQITTVTLAE
jgi:hypothetical protein